MIAHEEIAETDAFPIVEFGAGNGRLARDVVDAVARNAAEASRAEPRWGTFAARLRYHIYETSASLRDKQRALLGDAAVVAEGTPAVRRRRWRGTFPAACGASS